MKSLNKVIYDFRYKRIASELEALEGYFENISEQCAALGGSGHLYDENYSKYDKRYNKLYKKMEVLKK